MGFVLYQYVAGKMNRGKKGFSKAFMRLHYWILYINTIDVACKCV